jgi:D-3-phosphoglycerate dehydrogenase
MAIINTPKTPSSIRILHIDSNHPLLLQQLSLAGFSNDEDYHCSRAEIEAKIHNYKASSSAADSK